MLNEKKFKELLEKSGDHLVSIFIPTHRANQVQKDRIQFKNALQEATNQLEEQGLTNQEATSYLKEGFQLMEREHFLANLSDGLCLFVGEDYFHHEILPIDFTPYVYTGNQFYLRPVLPMLTGQSRFFLLALSQNEVRFFEGGQHSITPVIINDLVPASMESLFEMSDVQEHLQHHSGRGGGQSKPGAPEAMYHGQGAGKDDQDEDLKKYFKEINDGLMEMLYDEKPPMIVACVDYLLPLYKEVNTYRNLWEENVSGNPEGIGPVALHEKAWAIISQYYQKQQDENKLSFGEAMSQDRASAHIHDIVPAAVNGRVETLYINKDYHTYGRFEQDKNAIAIHTNREVGDQELLGLAAVKTYLQGGSVQIVERNEMPMPTANINAVFRY